MSLTLYQLQIQMQSKGKETLTLRLCSYSKIYISHCFGRSRLNGYSIPIKLFVDYAKGADCFFLQDIEFPGIVKEQVRLENNSGTYLEGGRGKEGTSYSLVSRTEMFVSVTSNFVANEALIVVRVLHLLDGGKSDCIHVHSVRVVA